MAVEYCNLTSHLSSVYKDIEKYKGLETLTGWESVAGAVYKLDQAGYYEMIFHAGVPMTAETTATTTPAAGKFSNYVDTDTLYVRLSGDGNPGAATMQGGLDWDARKTRARNDAQEMLEGFLGNLFPVPFQKIIAPDQSYNSELYDYWIRRSTALLTCWILVTDINPDDPAGDFLYKQVDNPNPEVGEAEGIIQRIQGGEIALKMQKLAREAGGFNVFEKSGNTATAFFEVTLPKNKHYVSREQIWRLQIDTAGTPGTATYKLSYDQGSNWDLTLQQTLSTDLNDKRIHIGSGIYCRFVGTFSDGDYVDIHLFPASDAATIQPAGSIRVIR
jgi:hypothetical protein